MSMSRFEHDKCLFPTSVWQHHMASLAWAVQILLGDTPQGQGLDFPKTKSRAVAGGQANKVPSCQNVDETCNKAHPALAILFKIKRLI